MWSVRTMANFWILAFALFAGASAASNDRIVGGNPTTINEYPNMGQVEFFRQWSGFWNQGCAGVILTRIHFLSAAHCYEWPLFNPSQTRFRVGSTYRNNGGFVHGVRRATNHPNYGRNGFDSDISVVELDSSVVYSPVVQQGTIVAPGTHIPDNSPVVHAGWGAVSQGGPASPILLDVTIYTVNNDLCRRRYEQLPRPGIVTPNMICAGLLDVGGRDACQGDSGGPLYYGNIVVGIVSWGHGCANETFPGISTAVSPFTEWVISVAR